MKKFLISALLIISVSAMAQKKPATPVKKPVTPVKKPAAAPATAFKSMNDSASYAMGISVGRFYEQQGVTQINSTLLAKGIADVLGKKKIVLKDEEMNILMNRYMSNIQEKKSKATVEAGEKFLASNKSKPGITTTASGLQYEVITMGTGPKPTAADSVTVHYVGTLIDGLEFDGSVKRGQPITFPLNGVIRGWTEGLQLMPLGSKFRFFIPYQLAYGLHDNQQIPGGSMLIFEVELLGIASGR